MVVTPTINLQNFQGLARFEETVMNGRPSPYAFRPDHKNAVLVFSIDLLGKSALINHLASLADNKAGPVSEESKGPVIVSHPKQGYNLAVKNQTTKVFEMPTLPCGRMMEAADNADTKVETADLPLKIANAHSCLLLFDIRAPEHTYITAQLPTAIGSICRHLPKNAEGQPDISKLKIVLNYTDQMTEAERKEHGIPDTYLNMLIGKLNRSLQGEPTAPSVTLTKENFVFTGKFAAGSKVPSYCKKGDKVLMQLMEGAMTAQSGARSQR